MQTGRAFGALLNLDNTLVAVGGIQDTDGDGRFDDCTSTVTETLELSRRKPQSRNWQQPDKWGNFGRCSSVLG